MPKIAKERTQENQRRIEAAALELFTTQGFHGTNNREIAEKLGMSTGAIYTYFPSKESIFYSLAQRYRSGLKERLKNLAGLKEPLSKKGLKKLAASVDQAMCEEPEYFLMLLSDVIEFKNQHFREVFRDIPGRFRRLWGPALERVKKQPGWRGEDPAFVMASAYVYFVTYFLMERYMQGELHLGLSDNQATEKFIDLIFYGLWKGPPENRRNRIAKNKETILNGKMARQSERDQIAYLRFLSGRLLSLPQEFPTDHAENGAGRQISRRPILFYPEIPRGRIDENQLQIEAAALDLFTRQGFNGTNMRDIAEKAEVSQGAIYNYYPSKEAIFQGLVKSYRHSIRSFEERVFRVMQNPFSEGDLRLFAAAMRSLVYDDGEYWLLMYIDVIEFKNQHFQTIFRNIPEQFRRLLGPHVNKVKKQPGWCGQDPALVMAMIFFYFHTYFVIERLMHGNRHLGVSDEEAIDRFIDVLLHGLWTPPPPSLGRRKR